MRWKYQKERPKFSTDIFLKMDLDKKYSVKIRHPEVIKKADDGFNKSVFKGNVVEVDGKKIDKQLIIKNYENVMQLKGLVKGKKLLHLALIRRYNEDNMETYYDIESI